MIEIIIRRKIDGREPYTTQPWNGDNFSVS